MIIIVHWRNPPAKLLCVGCEISAWLSCRIILSFIQFLGSLWFSQLSTLAWSSYVGFLIVVYKLIGGSIKISFYAGFVDFAALQQRFCFAKPSPIPIKREFLGYLINLWDETDIASVFLKNQSKLFFGVILRVVKHFTEIRFCERPVGGITYVFRSSNKSVLWRTLHTLSGGMAYFFSKIKLKCPLAYPP